MQKTLEDQIKETVFENNEESITGGNLQKNLLDMLGVSRKNANDITAETERATLAEQANAEAVATENARAKDAEKTIAGNLTAETKRATNSEQANAEAITAETERATRAEQEISKTTTTLREGLTTETKRATQAEGDLSQGVGDLRKGLTSETDRATKAEDGLSSRIDQNTKAISDGGALRPLYESLPNVRFNDATGFYEVWKDYGGLDDVTPSEMAQIYNYSLGADVPDTIKLPCYNTRAVVAGSFESVNRRYFAIDYFQATTCELVAINPSPSLRVHLSSIFIASKLRTIACPLFCEDDLRYKNMVAIENISLQVSKAKAFSIGISGSPVLNYTSLRYIPDNVIGTEYSNKTTIVLHATPYTLLNGDATAEQYKATGHTREEWMQIVTDSTAKGITFTQSL